MANEPFLRTSKADRLVHPEDHVMMLEEWQQAVRCGYFNDMDGSGCWLSNGRFMTDAVFDDVFGPVPEGATHVVWFNK